MKSVSLSGRHLRKRIAFTCEHLHSRAPHNQGHSSRSWAFAFTLLLIPALPLHAQGCAQCLDSTRATPAPVQAAYRHAIYLLGGAGATLFVVGACLIRNNR